MRRGVIDIGTNSVKLLVAECQAGDVQPVTESSRQTRLGQGLYETGQLQPQPIQATAAAVHEFLRLAKAEGASETVIIATSAMREAGNAAEFLGALGQAVTILSGDEEARLAYSGVLSNPRLAKRNLVVIDAGGGSTELTQGRAAGVEQHTSIPLGSVRLMERHPVDDPPTPAQREAAKVAVDERLRQTVLRDDWGVPSDYELVGTGGIATIFAMMELGIEEFDRNRIEQTELTRQRAIDWCDKLWSLPLAPRREITGLPANRTDVALFGSLIYERIMVQLGFDRLRVSTRGIRFGAVQTKP